MYNLFNLAPPSGGLGGGFGKSSDTIGDYNGAAGIGPRGPFNMQLALYLLATRSGDDATGECWALAGGVAGSD